MTHLHCSCDECCGNLRLGGTDHAVALCTNPRCHTEQRHNVLQVFRNLRHTKGLWTCHKIGDDVLLRCQEPTYLFSHELHLVHLYISRPWNHVHESTQQHLSEMRAHNSAWAPTPSNARLVVFCCFSASQMVDRGCQQRHSVWVSARLSTAASNEPACMRTETYR